MIKENYEKLSANLPLFNLFGEKITLVGATKTRSVEDINEAISAGLKDIGENRAQEFRDKFDKVLPCNYHFFGRLQKNKVKYLIGKACLIQSVDSVDLAEEISRQSVKNGVITSILLELNQGEAQKGGFKREDIFAAYKKVSALKNVCVKGLMTVLPVKSQKTAEICLQTRKIYDILRLENDSISVLSMGMSSDYQVALECGSNMIRIGQAIFGERRYEV